MDIAKVLIMGRPNVGKSTLINRLLKKKRAITYDEPGITRDLNEFLVTHQQHSFLVVDSGGILGEKNNEFEFQDDVEALVQTAIFDMSVVVFVVDAKDGVLPADEKIATLLRNHVPEKVVFVANKVDNDALKTEIAEFCTLGIGEPLPVSSLHDIGTERLLDRMTRHFNPSDKQQNALSARVKVGIVGRPNVGKSSLLNGIVAATVSIVNEKSGTTRDAIHSFFRYHQTTFEFIDTAGLRRNAKIKGSIEYYASVRTQRSIEEADVVVAVIDAERGFCNQDKRIIQRVIDAGKSLVVFVNKMDTLVFEDQPETLLFKDFKRTLTGQMPALNHYPICFGSASTKSGLDPLLKTVSSLFKEGLERVPTKMLNDFNRDVIRRFPPPAKYGKKVKIYYLTQIEIHPPTFICFINHKRYLTEDYTRFLESRIRAYLGGFAGHTIRLYFRNHRKEDVRSEGAKLTH